MFVSTPFSSIVSTDLAAMIIAADMLQDRPVVDLLWIVATVCFLVVFTLLIILIVVYLRWVIGYRYTSGRLGNMGTVHQVNR